MKIEITLKQFEEVVELKKWKVELIIEGCIVTAFYNEVDGIDWEITKGKWPLDTPFNELYELLMLVEECDSIHLILE